MISRALQITALLLDGFLVAVWLWVAWLGVQDGNGAQVAWGIGMALWAVRAAVHEARRRRP